MTPQDMFNRAYIGVIQQGMPGVRDGNCTYYRLTETGPVMCGIGHVVGKDTARALSAQQAGALCDIWSENLRKCDDDKDDAAAEVSELLGSDVVEHWAFADALQDAHDMSHSSTATFGNVYSNERFVRYFKQNMAELAEKYALTIPEVPNAP